MNLLRHILPICLALSPSVPAAEPPAMMTTWGEKVTPENVWAEYPRPAMERADWTNLNGRWRHAIRENSRTEKPDTWDGEILVPFAVESALSGVRKRITSKDAIWYERDLGVSRQAGKRCLLHFEAVDYRTTVWVNGKEVGRHTGGFVPFHFDITDALGEGTNTVTVMVTDATNDDGAFQPHGKQVHRPAGIFYTPVSGIWQTVWLEHVPENHIRALRITPSITGKVVVSVERSGAPVETTVVASLAGREVARTTGTGGELTLDIPQPKLWSPESPVLYDLRITSGQDEVKSYVGLRETSVIKGADGHLRLALNGREYFHWGTLDQGWWPDGLLTPPSDDAMASDIRFLKQAGFNTIRKHIKVEPRRYYTHCDRIGMLVWQDQVSSGTGKHWKDGGSSPKWTRLQPDPEDAQWPDEAHGRFMAEMEGMVSTLESHPCIVQWVPFNEAWGQHRTLAVGQWMVKRDPTRQINVASGGNFWPVGHIVDHHEYPHPAFPFDLGKNGRFDGFVKVVGEFGGHGYPVDGHLWNPEGKNWGYGGLPKDRGEWRDRYLTSLRKLAELRRQGIAAGIYTQTTDVEGEINGLLTYDRKATKVPADDLAGMLRESGLFAPPSTAP